MKLHQIIHTEAIVVPLTAGKREAAITELAEALTAAGALTAAECDAAVKAAIKREKRGSTGFGNGIAVPHAKIPGDRPPMAAVGICPAGMDFKSLDRQPVHAIFFLASPEGRPDDHVAAMEAIFSALSNAQFRKFLMQVRDRDEMIELLAEMDAGAVRA